jgi:hypothetical protein
MMRSPSAAPKEVNLTAVTGIVCCGYFSKARLDHHHVIAIELADQRGCQCSANADNLSTRLIVSAENCSLSKIPGQIPNSTVSKAASRDWPAALRFQ